MKNFWITKWPQKKFWHPDFTKKEASHFAMLVKRRCHLIIKNCTTIKNTRK